MRIGIDQTLIASDSYGLSGSADRFGVLRFSDSGSSSYYTVIGPGHFYVYASSGCFISMYRGADKISVGNLQVGGALNVYGTKNRVVKTAEYGERLLYSYETPSPLFGDVGEGVLDEDGLCYVFLDPVFAETITTTQYQVFLQNYGEGTSYVFDRKPDYFIVKGTPGLSFGWELKAKQSDFDQYRLEKPTESIDKGIDYGEQGTNFYTDLIEGRIAE